MKVKPRSEDATLTAEDLLSYKYVQKVFDKFAASKRLNPNVTWDDRNFQKKLQRLFKRMSKLETVAYAFTFGAPPKFEIHRKMFSTNQESLWWDTDEDEYIDEGSPDILKDYLKYNVAEKYSVSFQKDEMTDTDLKDRYYKPFFDSEGEKILDYYETTPSKCIKYLYRSWERANSDNSVEHEHIRNVVVSILKDKHVEEAVTKDLVDYLIEKNNRIPRIKGYDIIPFRTESISYRESGTELHSFGKQVLEAMGVDSKPLLVMGVGPQHKEDDILGITVLGDVKPAEDDIRETFGKMKKFLEVRDEQFMKMVSTQLNPYEDRVSEDFPQTGAGTQDQEVLKKAVDLYVTITNLTSAAVQAGVPRVLLMNSVDYLAIDLDQDFKLEAAIYKDGYFPKLVKCEYKWFNTKDHFIRLFFCSYIVPTLQYKSTVDKFRKHVSEAASQSIEKLLQSVTEALRLSGTDTQFERSIEWLRNKRAKFSSSTDTGTPLFSASGAKLIYPESFRDENNLNASTEFELHDDPLEFPFYAKISEAFLGGVRICRGAHAQVMLVDPKIFLQYIPKCFIFNDPTGVDEAILKIYDPLWRNKNRFFDIEGAVERYGKSLYDYWENEIHVYNRLLHLMGDVIPKVYSYGYVVDVSVKVGQVYRRYTGPYILMEAITWRRERKFETDEAVEKIKPVLEKIHELGIVHNYLGWDTVAFTEDGRTKIFDFSHSFYSEDESALSDETKLFHRDFQSAY